MVPLLRAVALVILLAAGGGTPGQAMTFDASVPAEFSLLSQRDPVLTVDGPLRSHAGDQAEWASPDYDDARWALDRTGESEPGDGGGVRWFRLRIVLPGDGRDYALLLPPIHDAYQVFVDGALSRTVGELPPHPRAERTLPTSVDLGSGSSRDAMPVSVALRTWEEAAQGQGRPARLAGPLVLGRAGLLQARMAQDRAAARWASSGWIRSRSFSAFPR